MKIQIVPPVLQNEYFEITMTFLDANNYYSWKELKVSNRDQLIEIINTVKQLKELENIGIIKKVDLIKLREDKPNYIRVLLDSLPMSNLTDVMKIYSLKVDYFNEFGVSHKVLIDGLGSLHFGLVPC